jgi:hypothetical protein
MKRVNNLYHLVYDFTNLYRAYLAARRGKRNKIEIIKFESLLSSNLLQLKEQLMNKSYCPGPYRVFVIREPKERVIMAPRFRDRVVQHSLCDNVLNPVFERHLIPFTFANRRYKGTHAALYTLSRQMQKAWKESGNNGCYILKCDISNYFYSINHSILKGKIRRLIKDKDILWLTDLIIDSTPGEVGIPIGNLTSQYFANYFLSEMDHLIKEKLRIKHYVRYMDDFTLIHHDKQYLVYCKEYLSNYLEHIGLTFNKKTQVFPLKNGVDFLGFHTYVTETGKIVRKLRRNSKKKMKRKLRFFQREYSAGRIDLDRIRSSIASWIGHAKHGNTYNLRKKILNKYAFSRGLNQ